MKLRKPSQAELTLIEFLVDKAAITNLALDWVHTLSVSSLNDGRMGSLLLFPNDTAIEGRQFGQCVSEYQFRDLDSVDVLASLNIDQEGQLFELDIWKVDFNPLISLPKGYS